MVNNYGEFRKPFLRIDTMISIPCHQIEIVCFATQVEFPPYVRLIDDVWLLDTLEFLECVPLGENSWIEDDLSGKKWNKTDKKSLLFLFLGISILNSP